MTQATGILPTRLMRSRRAGEEGRYFASVEAPARPSDQHCALCIFLKLLGMGPHAERIAMQMLDRYGSIGAIMHVEDVELEQEFGLPHLAIAQFRTVAQLHAIALSEELPARTDLSSHSSVQAFFIGKLRHLTIETCIVIFLDSQYCLIKEHVCATGAGQAVAVDPRAVLKAALLHNASAMVIGHNHPAGGAQPSEQDVQFTERLADGAASIGIELIDHIIVAHNQLFSFAAENLMR